MRFFGDIHRTIAYEVLIYPQSSPFGCKRIESDFDAVDKETQEKALQWLSSALFPVVNIEFYKKLSIYIEKSKTLYTRNFLSQLLNQCLLKINDQNPISYWRGEHEENYHLWVNSKISDDIAVKTLIALISEALRNNFFEIHALYKIFVTLMCIQKYRKESNFGKLPKELALFIARKATRTVCTDAEIEILQNYHKSSKI